MKSLHILWSPLHTLTSSNVFHVKNHFWMSLYAAVYPNGSSKNGVKEPFKNISIICSDFWAFMI